MRSEGVHVHSRQFAIDVLLHSFCLLFILFLLLLFCFVDH